MTPPMEILPKQFLNMKKQKTKQPEPPKPKARAKIVSKPEALERTDTIVDVDTAIDPETATPEIVETKPKPKRAATVQIIEQPLVVEPPPEKPKAVRKPRVKKEKPFIAEPSKPVRMSRVDKREQLYHSLASSALP